MLSAVSPLSNSGKNNHNSNQKEINLLSDY